jgi:hypothetical protein
VEVAVDGAVARLVGGDVARLLHRQLAVRACRGGHGGTNPLDGDLPRQLGDDDGRPSVNRELELWCEAERAEAPLDVADRAGGHGLVACVKVRKLPPPAPEAVLVHDRVAAGGFADGAVVERLRAADRAERDGSDDEGDPGCERESRMTEAPASDAHLPPPWDVSRLAPATGPAQPGSRTLSR